MPDPAKVFNDMCRARLKAIKEGTFEKLIKDREAMKEAGLSKDVLAAVNKCEEALPLMTADQNTKVCGDMKANLPKFTEMVNCIHKAISSSNRSALGNDPLFS
uniref:Uncharacterized protein n=2 Tax=Tetranychus urticae TaxID=32264 RepID=T1L2G6_TETUR